MEKIQHGYKIWKKLKFTKVLRRKYVTWDASEIIFERVRFLQMTFCKVWDERYFYKRLTGSFGSSSLNFNDFKLTTTIYRFYLTILVKLIQTWERMLGERERKVRKKENEVCLKELGKWMVKPKTKDLFGAERTRGEKDCWKFRWLLRRNKSSVSAKNIYGMRHLVDRRYVMDIFPCTLPKWWSSRFYEVLSLMKPFVAQFSLLDLEDKSSRG